MPLTSDTDLANLALRYLGISTEMQDMDAESSKEASAARRFFAPVREEVLTAWPWPFATQFVTLAAVTAPTTEWAYAYRYPANTLSLHRILNGFSRMETMPTRVAYRLASDDTGRLILTDQSPAVAEITALVVDVSQYDALFVKAFAHRLASDMALSLAGADKMALQQAELQQYQLALQEAMARAANEETPDMPQDSELIQFRDGPFTSQYWPNC